MNEDEPEHSMGRDQIVVRSIHRERGEDAPSRPAPFIERLDNPLQLPPHHDQIKANKPSTETIDYHHPDPQSAKPDQTRPS